MAIWFLSTTYCKSLASADFHSVPRMLYRLILAAALLVQAFAWCQPLPPRLHLPTANQGLLSGSGPHYFQFVDREFEGQHTTPWQGGQFGFVRDPRRIGSQVVFARFHEGMDVKPLRRDAGGDPLDEIYAILPGEVVYVTASATQSNYGRYIVIRHDWGQGPFYSLYAHLSRALVTAGQKVKAGATIARMGYTGSGINQQRAHLHVELNILLNSRFDSWHSAHFTTPNHHGIYNGLNLLGLNLQQLYLVQNAAGAGRASNADPEADFEIIVPGTAGMEILKQYPWLLDEKRPQSGPPSWKVRCTTWGLPISVAPGDQSVAAPGVTWVKQRAVPHYYATRGLVTGTGSAGKLTAEGLRFAQLLCGWNLPAP